METQTTHPDTDQSPTLGALAAAMAKAQGAIRAAAKDSTNPHFKSRYADLASIWTACREPLAGNGLAVLQRVGDHPEGVAITTQIIHSSGEWVRERMVVPLAQRTAQALGSAITYGRRYALAAMVGVAPDDDDDGNEATANAPRPQQGKRTAPAQASAREAKVPEEPQGCDSSRAVKLWFAQAREVLKDTETVRTFCAQTLQHTRPSASWTAEDVAKLTAALAVEAMARTEDVP